MLPVSELEELVVDWAGDPTVVEDAGWLVRVPANVLLDASEDLVENDVGAGVWDFKAVCEVEADWWDELKTLEVVFLGADELDAGAIEVKDDEANEVDGVVPSGEDGVVEGEVDAFRVYGVCWPSS